ncbi:MAG: hypothetical protein IJ666_00515 [Ruminococcus sp.]|nr:hypothetical protein [Ruminococcus sp.]
MSAINLDTNDVYEFDYNGTSITVENSELKASIVLKVNGEVKAETKGVKAVTGLGTLECKLATGETVKASLQKIKLGDSECKVTVDGNALALKSQSHGKKDVVEDAKNKVKETVDKVTKK